MNAHASIYEHQRCQPQSLRCSRCKADFQGLRTRASQEEVSADDKQASSLACPWQINVLFLYLICSTNLEEVLPVPACNPIMCIESDVMLFLQWLSRNTKKCHSQPPLLSQTYVLGVRIVILVKLH